MTLTAFFQENHKAALAFSGGVDSAYLLYAARSLGADVRPYYVKTCFQPEFEFQDAKKLTENLGTPMTVVEVDILSREKVGQNPPDRCYFCKKAILTAIWEAARRDGYTLLLDGTNASDAVSDRPGFRALQELSVRSPLREAGLTKQEIRELSRKAGLFTWDKPAYACLATRIPTGVPIREEALAAVERGEEALTHMGFRDFRLRLLGSAAKLQVREDQLGLVLEKRSQIREVLRQDFSDILLDLEARL